MILKSLLSLNMPVLSLTDSGEKALRLMSEYRVFHLPLIQRDNYLALISEDDLLDWDTPEEPLSLAEFVNFRPFVFEDAHPFEAIKVAKEFSLSLMPIVNAQNHFTGVVTVEGLFSFMADQNAIIEAGAIIVLEMEQRNYSLSEIARICESNDVSILSTQLKTINDTSRQWVSLKLNKTDINSLIATFERYNYQIVETFSANANSDDLKTNYDALIHYMNL
jgi:acetoin utilization protein AcuB